METLKRPSAILYPLTFLLIWAEIGLAQQQPPHDWLTWGGDAERTNWAKTDATLSPQNASGMELLWRAQLDAVPNLINVYATLTDPLVVENVPTREGPKTVVFVAGGFEGKDTTYAIDAGTGKVLWQKSMPTVIKPPEPAAGACPNSLNATPVIDKQSGIIYVLASDGRLHGLSLADGEDRMPPTTLVTPYSRSWSLNLIDGVVYAPSARGCGGAISNFAAMDVKDPSRPVTHFYTSAGKPSGSWGRGGMVRGPGGVYAQTADGPYDPAAGRYGETVMHLTKDLRLVDSYTPSNWKYLNTKDLDLGSSSPVIFPFEKWTLVAVAGKEGVITLLDAKNLGGLEHHTPLYVSPRYGNDRVTVGYTGVWGAMSTWVDAQSQRWLLVPMLGPTAKDHVGDFKAGGSVPVNGSVMAFQVKLENEKPVLVPAWISRDLDLPGMPIAANGVVYVLATGDRAKDEIRSRVAAAARADTKTGQSPARAQEPGGENGIPSGPDASPADIEWKTLQMGPGGQVGGKRFSGDSDLTHAVLYALDAATGKEIFSSKDRIDSWNHYGAIALANGRLYVSAWDARVYAFGLKK